MEPDNAPHPTIHDRLNGYWLGFAPRMRAWIGLISGLGRPARIALVLGGYVVAFLAAVAVVAIHVAATSGPETQDSSGMYAFGDALLFVAVFGGLALVPTGLALYWLRNSLRFWNGLTLIALIVAATALAAGLIFMFADLKPGPAWQPWDGVAVLRILLTPLLATGFAAAALIAPTPGHRRRLLIAAAMEGTVALYALIHWFAPVLRP